MMIKGRAPRTRGASDDGALRQQRAPRPQREQRAGHGWGSWPALAGDDAERHQLGGAEIAGLIGGQDLAEVSTDQAGDGLRVASAIDPGGGFVQQRRHLDDLAIGPPHQRRRLAVAGILVLPSSSAPPVTRGTPAGPGAPAWSRAGGEEWSGGPAPGRAAPACCASPQAMRNRPAVRAAELCTFFSIRLVWL